MTGFTGLTRLTGLSVFFDRTKRKLSAVQGISRLLALLLTAVAVLSAASLTPFILRYRDRAVSSGCNIAAESATRRIRESAVLKTGGLTPEEALAAANEVIQDFDRLCPTGGDYYLIPTEDGSYEAVCALHSPDLKLRTRLCAGKAMEQLQHELKIRNQIGEAPPEQVTATVNGSTLEILRVTEELTLRSGTASRDDLSGTVARYMAKNGKLVYFCYADENHAAIWRDGDGWSGDSF